MATLDASQSCCQPGDADELTPSNRPERLVAAFRALGDPARLEVFRLIAAQNDPICVCHIVDRFDLSQPTISHHLRVLREAGLVTVSRRGVWAYYALDPQGLAFVRGELADLLVGHLTAV